MDSSHRSSAYEAAALDQLCYTTRDYSHAPQLQSAGGVGGSLTDSVAIADVKTAMITKITANHVVKVRIVFIVLYFMTQFEKSFALSVI